MWNHSGCILTPQCQGFHEFHFIWIQGVSNFLGLGKRGIWFSLRCPLCCFSDPKDVTLCHAPCHHQNRVWGAVPCHIYEDLTFWAPGAVPGCVPATGSPSKPPDHSVLCPSPGQHWRRSQEQGRTETAHDRKERVASHLGKRYLQHREKYLPSTLLSRGSSIYLNRTKAMERQEELAIIIFCWIQPVRTFLKASQWLSTMYPLV